MERAEEILKQKLDVKIAILNNPNYTFNKVIEAMEQYADERSIRFNDWVNVNAYKYPTKKTTAELLEIFKKPTH